MDPSTTPTETAPAPAATAATGDQGLGQYLVQNGLLTAEQLAAALRYASDHQLDLRQAILEMNLISSERLTALAFERLSTLAGGNGQPDPAHASAAGILPDRDKLERDTRNELKQIAATATPSDLVDQIVQRAYECRATDIHFDPQDLKARVRYRIDSQLHDVLDLDPVQATAIVSRIKVASNLNIVERRHPQDGRMTIAHGDRPRDLRVSTIPTALGEKIVIRIHEALTDAFGLDQLGLEAHQVERLSKLIERPYGAVLVGGPVGAGKTTTLYNCMQRVNLTTRNLMTIEDPIEYRLDGVNQVQVDNRIGLSFSEGLRAILRQDPDVLMIGEIRDDETAQIGIRAALTGVLVFSTIHASDAASTIGSLYNFGIPGYLLSASLQGVVSQRLVRKICPYCRVQYPADETTVAALDLDHRQYLGHSLHRGAGCKACFQTGYLGRTGIFEVMELGEELRELVLRQTPKEVLRQVAMDLGMQTLKRSAVDKVLEGTTTVEEVHRVVSM
jgi:type II secretory ATPase GspE/PulE/Tfp pilus assembly ATPase PilB-like protein